MNPYLLFWTDLHCIKFENAISEYLTFSLEENVYMESWSFHENVPHSTFHHLIIDLFALNCG